MRTFDAGTSPCQPDSALLPAPHGVLMDQALNTDAKEASSGIQVVPSQGTQGVLAYHTACSGGHVLCIVEEV